MVDLPREETDVMADYLAKYFPETPKPPAVLIPGSASVSIREWLVPTLGSRPHDPLYTPDGAIWWTGQWANVLGRLDPETGKMKEYPLKTPKSGPHGLAADKEGNIWYTMEIHEYTLPHPESRPRRLTVTRDDAIWYSDYSRGYLGRLDPETGDVQEWPSPGGAGSQPYGIAAIGDIVWYSESRVSPNTIVRFDPKTEKFQTWTIPSGGGVVRNMMATPEGDLVLACSAVNRVALVEIEHHPPSE
jgi:virginiamycin B lyase